MKVGDIVYRKAPFRVTGIGIEKNDGGDKTHLSLTPVENTQYINCLEGDVEVQDASRSIVPPPQVPGPNTTVTPSENYMIPAGSPKDNPTGVPSPAKPMISGDKNATPAPAFPDVPSTQPTKMEHEVTQPAPTAPVVPPWQQHLATPVQPAYPVVTP